MMLLFISGCDEYHKENYLDKYNDFLIYSFKDYKIVEVAKNVNDTKGPLPVRGYHYRYEISYLDNQNKEHSFMFTNYDEFDIYGLVENLMTHISERVTDIMEENYVIKYFNNTTDKEEYRPAFSVDINLDEENKKDLLDYKTGKAIKFTDFDLETLNQYEASLNMSININLEYCDLENAKLKVLDIANQIYKDTNNKDISGDICFYLFSNNTDMTELKLCYDSNTNQMILTNRESVIE